MKNLGPKSSKNPQTLAIDWSLLAHGHHIGPMEIDGTNTNDIHD
jgi:hypothetical protein